MVANQGQHPRLCIGASLLALMPIVGCSSSPVGSVSGEVTFNSEPLDDAVIRYQPTGSGHNGGGQGIIENGSYQVEGLSAGEYRVWIFAERKTGRKIRSLEGESGKRPKMVDQIVQIIPIKYNARTELRATIQDGENQQDFQLTR